MQGTLTLPSNDKMNHAGIAQEITVMQVALCHTMLVLSDMAGEGRCDLAVIAQE